MHKAEFKGKLWSEKVKVYEKERENEKKSETSPTSMRQMVLEIFHFKVRNLSKMDIAIL